MKIKELLGEKITYVDRDYGGHIAALNPTRSEWNAKFPNGAGGVLMKNGHIVIGAGEAYSHSDIMHDAGVNWEDEWARLQIWDGKIQVELWDDLPDSFWGKGISRMSEKDVTPEQFESLTEHPLAERKKIGEHLRNSKMVSRFYDLKELIVTVTSTEGNYEWVRETY